MAKKRGWIKLIDGARRHFDHWQPVRDRLVTPVKTREAAECRWPDRDLERAYTFKAMNSLSQGGSARQMKRAMVAVYKAGIVPLIQMHDELGASISSARKARIMEECMVHAVELVVPTCVDIEVGPDWGHAKKSLAEMGL
jgi:DNA polymerase I-like protein with 3'-5' exonuclease and polymerase domains